MRALWLPDKSGTTLTDKSRHARVLTWSEDVSTFDTEPAELGSGYAITFNGADEEGDSPDADDLSFGDGAVDQPFSVLTLVNPTAAASTQTILAKYRGVATEDREWRFYYNGSEQPTIEIYDESADAALARRDATALTSGAWVLLAGTYDGSGASTGLRLYKDATRVDDTDVNSGTYTAMENGTHVVSIGDRADNADFFNGKMALAFICAKSLTIDDIWAVKEACNGYFGLSL